MTIRARLTLLFSLLVGSILLLFSVSIYLLYNQYREVDFYDRLHEKAKTTVKVREDAGDVARNDLPVMVGERVTIYNSLNQVIFSAGQGFNPSLTGRQFRQIREGHEIRLTHGEIETIGIRYKTLVVVATAYDQYGFNKLRRLREILIFGWLASFFMVGVAGWLFASDALRPVSEIIDQVNAISATNIHERLHVSRKRDELAELAHTFNDMLNRLEEAFVTQRSFVSHASHELRTPLAIMRGNIDVALMQPRDVPYYQQTLTDVLDEVQTMVDLANGLLDLARASSESTAISFRPTRLDELLWQARTKLLSKNPKYVIDIDFESLPDQDDDLTIQGEEALLRTAFQNLMENGCKYSANGSVAVRISFAPNQVQIAFADTGYGIPAEALPHLFEPFYRSPATTSVASGHGIGLALTHRIVMLHSGSITVQSKEGEGTTVTVQFPLPVARPSAIVF
ncbi:sensor histidine kinase [uncultured Fibrella sp.]|uniref:sensor histidine kinase n=1 Tax=uncultured Fibrella sp. TaxID=1284596 RepID=UPI0035C96A54